MKLLVFQHIECEHPGSFRQFFSRDNIEWEAVNLDQGDAIPKLENYDALWVMGGPMDIWDVEEYPWLIEEKKAIRMWVNTLKKPFLGLCLGHQLLADALGGTCGPQQPSEVGVYDVLLTEAGVNDPLFKHTPVKQKCVQWHSVRVAQAPDNAVVLAQSDNCAIQAMRVGQSAWSMQYHVEVEADTVEKWAQIPTYREALMNTLGEGGYDQFKQEAEVNRDTFLRTAETIYNNFWQQVSSSK